MFDLYDGVNYNANKFFRIQVKTKDSIYPSVVNKGISLEEGGRISINTDLLTTKDLNSNDAELTFTVRRLPKFGKLLNLDHPEESITSFTQVELISNKIQYVHDSENEDKQDTFEFSVSDGENQLFRTFRISITDVDNKLPVLEAIRTIRVSEGLGVEITPFEVKISDKDTSADKIIIKVITPPRYGIIHKASESAPVEQFSLSELRSNVIKYQHLGTEEYRDSFDITISDSTHPDFIYQNIQRAKPVRVFIEVSPIDNKTPILEVKNDITSLQDVSAKKF